MAGANHLQPKPSSHRKSRWESSSATSKNPNPDPKSQQPPKPSTSPKSNPNHNNKSKFTGGGGGATSNLHKKPTPANPQLKPNPSPSHANSKQQLRADPGPNHQLHHPDPYPFPDLSQMGPPPQPTYGFHMLLRRTIVLSDGSVRSYFALPPDYQDFAGPPRPGFDGPGQQGPFRGGLLSPEGAVTHDGYGCGRERESQDYWNLLGLDSNNNMHGGRRGGSELGLKRKFNDDEREGRDRGGKEGEYSRQRQKLLQYGNANLSQNQNLYHLGAANERSEGGPSGGGAFRRDSDEEPRSSKYLKMRPGEFDGGALNSRQAAAGGGNSVVGGSQRRLDMEKVNKEFLRFVKMINETVGLRKKYLENGMQGSLHCVPCGRSSKEFPDMHGLIMHAYHSDNTDLLADHMGFHKALCVLMGWSYLKPPDNSKSYQHLSAVEAAANQDDLIMWPPTVIIHNTCTGKNKEKRMEGLGNKMMDSRLREIGFTSGKAKSLYGKEGHQGITLVKFPGDRSGLKEAIRLSEFLEKENHGRKGWALVESSLGNDDTNNPALVKLDEKTKETKRILYGYLGTAADQDKVDFDTRKKVVIQSIKETLK